MDTYMENPKQTYSFYFNFNQNVSVKTGYLKNYQKYRNSPKEKLVCLVPIYWQLLLTSFSTIYIEKSGITVLKLP